MVTTVTMAMTMAMEIFRPSSTASTSVQKPKHTRTSTKNTMLLLLILLVTFITDPNYTFLTKVTASSSTSSSSFSTRRQHSRQRQRQRTMMNSQISSSSSSSSFSKNTTPPSCCRFFIWDGLSACRYHICKRLLRDNVYEGMGGKKFVRIKPGSMLETLYPPSKHGPDRCIICGMSYRDHLRTWWFPRLYTPFDLYLDRVTDEEAAEHAISSSLVVPNGDDNGYGGRNGKKTRANAPKRKHRREEIKESSRGMVPYRSDGIRDDRILSGRYRDEHVTTMFHERYVRKYSDSFRARRDDGDGNTVNKSNRRRGKRTSWTNGENNDNSGTTLPMETTRYEKRRMRKIRYMVPKFQLSNSKRGGTTDDDDDDNIDPLKTILKAIVREMVLTDFDVFLCLEQKALSI